MIVKVRPLQNASFVFKPSLFGFALTLGIVLAMFHHFNDTNMSHNTKTGLYFGGLSASDLISEIGLWFKSLLASNVGEMLP